MSVRRPAPAVALWLALALLLGGCADDPEPRFAEPTRSSSPTPSDDASTPAAQRQNPEEFIREWVALDTRMQNTGETADYLAVSRSCSACRAVAERVDRIFSSGGYIRTKGWSIDRITRLPASNRFRLRGSASDLAIVRGEGEKEVHLPGGPIAYDIVLRRSEQGWRVDEILEVAR